MRTRESALQRRTTHRSPALFPGASDADDPAVLRRELADEVTLGVRDDYVVIEVHAEVLRAVHRRGQRGSAVAGAALRAAGIDDGFDFAVGRDNAQCVAAAFEDVNVPLAIHRYGARVGERGVGRENAVLGSPLLPIARDNARLAGCNIQLVDAREVSDEELRAREIQCDAIRPAAARLLGRYAVAGEARDGAGLHIHLAHTPGPSIADKHVAIGQHGEVVRAVELGLKRRPAIARRASLAGARDMREQPRRVHLEQAVARGHLDDEEIAGAVEVHAERFLELRVGGGDADGVPRPARDEDNLFSAQRRASQQHRHEEEQT